jgi:hypothetical protein
LRRILNNRAQKKDRLVAVRDIDSGWWRPPIGRILP